MREGVEVSEDELTIQVMGAPDSDAAELADLASRLRTELARLDGVAVELRTDDRVPEHSKGLGVVVGWLTATVSVDRLAAVIRALRSWAGRNGRSIEVTIDGDELKLSHATEEQQERVIAAWLERHSAGV